MIRRLILALAACLALAGPAGAAAPHTVAFFGFDLINTSLEPTRPDETARIAMLDGLLRDKLEASGRFKVLAIPPEIQQEVARTSGIRNCNGCERGLARRIGADWAAWGTVQKVSNLILNINLYMEDARTGEMTFVKSVDIRGNTDETWQHGLNYMIRHYLLGEP